MITFRQVRESDAAALLELCLTLDGETGFMMLEPGERRTTAGEQGRRVRQTLAAGNRTIIVAEAGGWLVGYVEAVGGDFRRNRHCAHVVAGVLREFGGRGIGARLFAELEGWARRSGIGRLELTVMAHNERAIALYLKMGYEVEGRRRGSLLVDGARVDEFYMGKLLA
jgi:RimJ/RimL family protein N-acetyltransferase